MKDSSTQWLTGRTEQQALKTTEINWNISQQRQINKRGQMEHSRFMGQYEKTKSVNHGHTWRIISC